MFLCVFFLNVGLCSLIEVYIGHETGIAVAQPSSRLLFLSLGMGPRLVGSHSPDTGRRRMRDEAETNAFIKGVQECLGV